MSRMIKSARWSLILIFWILAGGLSLAAGESPFRTVLILAGLTIATLAINLIFDRARMRQGKPADFSFSFSDIESVSPKDLLQLAPLAAAGFGLSILALVAFRGGA
jgi:hypothetical protein